MLSHHRGRPEKRFRTELRGVFENLQAPTRITVKARPAPPKDCADKSHKIRNSYPRKASDLLVFPVIKLTLDSRGEMAKLK